jgi:hypothetical protein
VAPGSARRLRLRSKHLPASVFKLIVLMSRESKQAKSQYIQAAVRLRMCNASDTIRIALKQKKIAAHRGAAGFGQVAVEVRIFESICSEAVEPDSQRSSSRGKGHARCCI